MYYVYEHWRTDLDLPFYVGKGKGNRAYNMFKRNAYHKAITAKLRREGFAVEVRIIESGITEQRAFEIEISRIELWKKSGVDLTNMTCGGEGSSGRKISEETKAKMRASHKGKPKSPEHIAKVAAAQIGNKRGLGNKNRLGHKMSPKTRAKMKESQRLRRLKETGATS